MRAVEFLERPLDGLAPCYLLKGGDGFMARAVVDKILSTLPPEDREFNYDEFDDDASIVDAVAALETVTLTGGKRVVYLRKRTRQLSDGEKKALSSYCAMPEPDSVLIIEDTPRAYDDLGGYPITIECTAATESEMKRGITVETGKRGCTISRAAIDKLAAYCNLNYGRVAVEVAKLCDYADGGRIEESAVEALVAPDADYRGYLLASAFDEGDIRKALKMWEGMKSKGEPAAKILAMLTSSFRKTFHCAISSLDDRELASALGTTESSVRTTRRIIRDRKRSVSGYVVKLKEQTEYLRELEYKFKSGVISEDNALRLAVAKLSAVNKREAK